MPLLPPDPARAAERRRRLLLRWGRRVAFALAGAGLGVICQHVEPAHLAVCKVLAKVLAVALGLG